MTWRKWNRAVSHWFRSGQLVTIGLMRQMMDRWEIFWQKCTILYLKEKCIPKSSYSCVAWWQEPLVWGYFAASWPEHLAITEGNINVQLPKEYCKNNCTFFMITIITEDWLKKGKTETSNFIYFAVFENYSTRTLINPIGHKLEHHRTQHLEHLDMNLYISLTFSGPLRKC